jgi:hypothetical protein
MDLDEFLDQMTDYTFKKTYYDNISDANDGYTTEAYILTLNKLRLWVAMYGTEEE